MIFSHETGYFLVGGNPKLIIHEIFSLDMRFSHETRDRRFSHWGGTQNWYDMRFSLETWDFLMRQETGDFLMGGLYKKMSCLMKKSHVSRENLMFQEDISYLIIFGPPNKKISCLLSHKKISYLMRNSHISCFLCKSHMKISWDMKFSHKTGDRRFSMEGAV